MKKYWVREFNMMAIKCQTSKKEEDLEMKELMNEFVDDNLVNMLLKLYIERIKVLHALAFFQFRRSMPEG